MADEIHQIFFENHPEPMWIYDREELRILAANDAAITEYGYSREEFLEMTIKDIRPPEDVPQLLETVATLTPGFHEGKSWRHKLKNGTIIEVEIRSHTVEFEGHNASLVVARDITELKRAETALRESEARYRDLIEGSNLGIQIGTRNSGRVYANQACADLFGYETAEELIKAPPQALIAEHDRERIIGYRDAFYASEDTFLTHEIDGLRKDGSIFPIEVFARRIVWYGEEAIYRTFIDLTERKLAEDQLRQAQKMEVVGQLTGGVAHDFNNLLTVILGGLDLIERRLDDDQLKILARNALNATRRGADLTQRLLAFSRKQSLAPKPIDLSETVTGMLDLIQTTVGETVDVEVRLDEDIWKCEADPSELENAILNLAINARDAMPQGGRLTIETRNKSIGGKFPASHPGLSSGDYVMVSVSDTGEGIPREFLDRVFEPFFTTKEVGEGSGLGLSMVYGFIKQSGGDVEMRSVPAEGTTIELYLPRSFNPAEHTDQPIEIETPSGGNERILVVEDQADVREITVNMLKELGYRVVEAARGDEALQILQSPRTFEMLVTDMVLPGGITGMAVASEARRLDPDISVLFITGYTDDPETQKGGVSAEFDLLRKPFNKSELGRKLRSALDASSG